MKIGNVDIGKGVVFAPMAGFSDIGFRYLTRVYGADLTYTEMVSAKGLYYNSKKTKELLATSDIEKPVAIQLFGSDVNAFKSVLDRGLLDKFDIIDINMGCPVRKIVSNGEGSALMKNIPLAQEIVKTLKLSNKPVSVKFRSGFEEVIACEFAKAMQDSGANSVTIHARTREQFYAGASDWNVIKDVKRAVDIPVIGNGDILRYEDIARMKEYTDCDGVMIGRAALGNPYIFSNSKPKSIKEDIKTHINMLLDIFPEKIVVNLIKKHLCFYGNMVEKTKQLRINTHNSKSINDIWIVVEKYF